MAKTHSHKFHLVDQSALPLLTSLSLFMLAIGGVLSMHSFLFGPIILVAAAIALITCAYSWWRDVIREGRVDQAHTDVVRQGLAWGMLLFIGSEIMFFFAFFWSFFKAWLAPEAIIEDIWPIAAGVWPPAHIHTLDPWDIPLLNTVILLLSGTTVTWAHFELLKNNRKNLVKGLLLTVILGICFTALQIFEYAHAAHFKFTDGVYASNFYMATGFHGAHVFIGTIFLAVCYFRARKGHFDQPNNHLGFEFAAWYWHFVDVVWLFLYIFLYILSR